MTIKELREILSNPYLDQDNQVTVEIGNNIIPIDSYTPRGRDLVLSAMVSSDLLIGDAAIKYAEDKENPLHTARSFMDGARWAISNIK